MEMLESKMVTLDCKHKTTFNHIISNIARASLKSTKTNPDKLQKVTSYYEADFKTRDKQPN